MLANYRKGARAGPAPFALSKRGLSECPGFRLISDAFHANRQRRCMGADRAALTKETGHPVKDRTREDVMFLETVDCDGVFRRCGAFDEMMLNDGIPSPTTGGICP